MDLGSDSFGEIIIGGALEEAGIGQPIGLNSYQNTDTDLIAYWSYSPFTTAFPILTWELQTDIVDTFDSPSLLTYSSSTIATERYLVGCGHRGMVVPIYPRLQSETLRMYWRVRGTYEGQESEWGSGFYDVPSAVDEETRNSVLSFLPDTLYNKESNSNVYKLHDSIAKEFELVNRELTKVNGDLYINSARDSSLGENFGDLTGIERPGEMKVIDYREILKAFVTNIRTAPGTLAIRNLVFSVFRNDPEFKRISDVYGVYQYDTGIEDAYVVDTYLTEQYVWDNEHLAGGMIVEVDNQLACGSVITKEYIERIMRFMVQTRTPVYLSLV